MIQSTFFQLSASYREMKSGMVPGYPTDLQSGIRVGRKAVRQTFAIGFSTFIVNMSVSIQYIKHIIQQYVLIREHLTHIFSLTN